MRFKFCIVMLLGVLLSFKAQATDIYLTNVDIDLFRETYVFYLTISSKALKLDKTGLSKESENGDSGFYNVDIKLPDRGVTLSVCDLGKIDLGNIRSAVAIVKHVQENSSQEDDEGATLMAMNTWQRKSEDPPFKPQFTVKMNTRDSNAFEIKMMED